MSKYPTRLVVQRSSRGYRVTGRFRGPTGRAYTQVMFTSKDRQTLRKDLEEYLVAAATNVKMVDVGGM